MAMVFLSRHMHSVIRGDHRKIEVLADYRIDSQTITNKPTEGISIRDILDDDSLMSEAMGGDWLLWRHVNRVAGRCSKQ